jgi:hypothetical protein
MAKFSMKQGGKEVGPASTYAKPHDMKGKAMSISDNPGKPSELEDLGTMRMSVGMINTEPHKPAKTSGIKIRGTGAATKGTMARGPMA